MAYYDWEKIMMLKDSSEIHKIIRDRVLGKEALEFAKKELLNRSNSILNDDRFIRRKDVLQNNLPNHEIREVITFSGICFTCHKNSHYLHVKEKFQGLRMFGVPIHVTGPFLWVITTPFGVFFPFRKFGKGKEGHLSICVNCGHLFIKCPKCKTFQVFESNPQICSSCSQKMIKPEITND